MKKLLQVIPMLLLTAVTFIMGKATHPNKAPLDSGPYVHPYETKITPGNITELQTWDNPANAKDGGDFATSHNYTTTKGDSKKRFTMICSQACVWEFPNGIPAGVHIHSRGIMEQ